MSSPYLLQRFVSAKEANASMFSSKKKTENEETGKMSGEEARKFYENVLSSDCSNLKRFNTSRERHRSRRRESEQVHTVSLNFSCPKTITDDGDNDDDCDDYKHKNLDFKHDGESVKSLRRSQRELESCTPSHQRLVNQFLQNAQEGRLRQVEDLLSKHCIDINVCDQFSWTALMCASHSGQFCVVKYLLDKGAEWRNHKDSQGRTALDLARLANNFNVVDLLLSINDGAKTKHKKMSKKESCTKKAKFWCSICEQEFTDSRKVHHGSTVHLFNTQRKPQKTFYYIPDGNVGYQMMLKSGWNEEKGLGPEGIGRKFPVKTVLKRDRLGLGSKESKQARVTHFGPNDHSAVRRRKVGSKLKQMGNKSGRMSQRERLTKEKKEKNWERNMRIYMNSE